MKQLIIKAILFSALSAGLTACLKKDAMYIDSSKSSSVVEFANTGDDLSGATSVYPGFYTDLGTLNSGASAKFNLNLDYAGADAPSEDITINIGIDTAALSAYNTQNGTSYVVPPADV